MTAHSDDALAADEAADPLLGALAASARDPRESRTRVLLAVSGGPDSLAMMVLLGERLEVLRSAGVEISVATVDHGFRPEAEAEARFVAGVAGEYGLAHRTLRWRGWTGRGNLQAAAREARYDLLAREAARLGARAVVTAHHEDDQIETHLLARGRGASGARLAGMRRARALAPGVALLRPFLCVPRERLRAALPPRRVEAVRDPSNEDLASARVRLRNGLADATPQERAAHLCAIRVAREQRSAEDAGFLEAVWADPLLGSAMGDLRARLRWPADAFRSLSPAHMRRFVARAVTAAGGAATPPPGAAVERLAHALRDGRSGFAATLNGCQVRLCESLVVFAREYGRSGPPPTVPGPDERRAIFDRRFDVLLPSGAGAGRLLALGCLGRGNAVDRTLPVLVDEHGQAAAAPAFIGARFGSGCRGLSIRPVVLWRFLADLRDRDGNPPRKPFTIVDPQEPGGPYRLVLAPVTAPGSRG